MCECFCVFHISWQRIQRNATDKYEHNYYRPTNLNNNACNICSTQLMMKVHQSMFVGAKKNGKHSELHLSYKTNKNNNANKLNDTCNSFLTHQNVDWSDHQEHLDKKTKTAFSSCHRKLIEKLMMIHHKKCTTNSRELQAKLGSHFQAFILGQMLALQGIQDVVNDLQILAAPLLTHFDNELNLVLLSMAATDVSPGRFFADCFCEFEPWCSILCQGIISL